ncbi:UTRA domain-containing protein [Streptomyces sp. 3214.6]|nr:UTRA domain-containing protein [Streptomyces sp. 3214.6]
MPGRVGPRPGDFGAGYPRGRAVRRTTYGFLTDGRPVQLSTSWEPYDRTAGTLVVLPERGPHAGAGVVNRMAAIGITVGHAVEQPEPRQATAEEASLLGVQKAALVTHTRRTYYSDDGRPVETADIVVPAAHCEIVPPPAAPVVALRQQRLQHRPLLVGQIPPAEHDRNSDLSDRKAGF